MKRRIGFIPAAALVAAAAAGSAFAADLPKEGKFDYTACWSGVSNAVSYSKSHTAFSFEMTGAGRSNPSGGMFDKHTFRCVGMNASLGGKNSGTAVCESIDADGDKRLTYFSNTPDGVVTREHVAGTGKYDGIVINAKVAPLGPFPTIKAGTFQNCNQQTGTYKMK